MPGLWSKAIGLLRKNSSPDWSTLERYLGWLSGGPSATGIIINPQSAMRAAAVYSCVQVLSQTLGMVPLNLYNVSDKNERTPAKSHPLWPLLYDQPNDFQTSVEFWEFMMVSLLLRGNGYAFINRTSTGRVVELLPLPPDGVRAELMPNFVMKYTVTMANGGPQVFGNDQVMHIRGLTFNGWQGITPIAYAREAIGLALATEKYGAQLFRNGAKASGVLEIPGVLSNEAYTRLKESFDESTSGENAHKTALLEDGTTYKPISISPDDSQFLETRKYQRSEIAAMFRVPGHMIGDLEKATFANIEQLSLEFINFSMMHWFVRIEKACQRDLLTPAERKTMRVKYNPAGLQRGDSTARSNYYKNGIFAGYLTRNEAREMESELGIILNPLADLDEPLKPLNMVESSVTLDSTVQPPMPSGAKK